MGQASTPGLEKRRARSGSLWIFFLVATAASVIVSALSVSAAIVLAPSRDPTVHSILPLLSMPSWQAASLFAEPGLALIVASVLLRRPGRVMGAIGAGLALISVPCLVFIGWAAVLWFGCATIACDGTQAAIDELAHAPTTVGVLMAYAVYADLVAIPLCVGAVVGSLVLGFRRPMERNSVT